MHQDDRLAELKPDRGRTLSKLPYSVSRRIKTCDGDLVELHFVKPARSIGCRDYKPEDWTGENAVMHHHHIGQRADMLLTREKNSAIHVFI